MLCPELALPHLCDPHTTACPYVYTATYYAPHATVCPPRQSTPKVLLRWTYTGVEAEKKGSKHVLKDGFMGGVMATSDSVAAMGSFGQCRVEGVDEKGFLYISILDSYHDNYEGCTTVPPEEVYLHGNGNMQIMFAHDYAEV